MPELAKVKKGQAPSLLDTAKANSVIAAVNGVLNMTVSPDGVGQLHVSGVGTERVRVILHLEPGEGGGSARVRAAFNLLGTGGEDALVSVVPGVVNGIMPTINDTPLDDDEPPALSLSTGTHMVYLRATVDNDPASDTFSNILSAEVIASDEAIFSTFDTPVLLLGQAVVTGAGTDASPYAVAVRSDVWGSLALVRFFANYTFIPYFAIPAIT